MMLLSKFFILGFIYFLKSVYFYIIILELMFLC